VPQRVVVVGAAMGGLRTAEALRKAGFTGEIVVVGEEAHLPYSRPPLSKEVLSGEVSHDAVAFPLRAAVADVRWRLRVRAESVDLESRTVRLDDATELGYDGLVIATGLRSRRLAGPGPAATAATGRHALRTLDDAVGLRAVLDEGVRVVVVGAGFLGCEVAATARGLGCHVAVTAADVEAMVQPLGPMLGAELRHRHEQQGVGFHLGATVTRFLGTDRVAGVELSTGERLRADVVVEAVGSHCNTEWLAGAGLDLSDGVLCDNALRVVRADGTPVDGVHAVGDVARFPNPRFDEVARRVEHWNMPTETARRVGPALASYLAGHGYRSVLAQPFAPLPAFWSDQYDTQLQSYGAPGLVGDGPDDVRVLEGDLHGEVVVGYHRDGDLVGVVGLGMLPRVNSYRPLIGRPPT
jgi:3-phenylpropionate/trans-cinnamate dioxygenase ferredoxin reductase subunit